MLIHYCVIAFKNIWKYKVSASISILGLAFALVCFVPILYWMDHETTYDSFYKDSESIYRVYSVEKQSGKVNKGASKGIENSLREQVPAIEASTTLMLSTENCRTQATPYIQMNMLYTDSTFLEVFPQSFVCGEMNHPLQIVNNMILSERTAVRLFGWLLAGGIIYTVGGIIYALKVPLFDAKHKNFGSHEIFHLFVMAGSACHFILMYVYIA